MLKLNSAPADVPTWRPYTNAAIPDWLLNCVSASRKERLIAWDNTSFQRKRASRWMSLHRQMFLGLTRSEVFMGSALIILTGFLIFTSSISADASYDRTGGSGSAAYYPLILGFAFIPRNSLWNWFFGISFEKALFFHKLCAYPAVLMGALHGLWAGFACQPYNESGDPRPPAADYPFPFLESMGKGDTLADGTTQCHWAGWSAGVNGDGILTSLNWTGIWLLVAMFAMTVLSQTPIREYWFNLFLWVHWVCIAAVIVFSVLHGAAAVFAGAVFVFADLAIRWYLKHKYLPTTAIFTRLPANVIRMELPKGAFNYHAGQYIFLCVPELSCWEYHPFSFSSAPGDDKVMVHIRVLGNWTQRLHDLVTKAHEQAAAKDASGSEAGKVVHDKTQGIEFKVLLDGPYGKPSVDLYGGAGVKVAKPDRKSGADVVDGSLEAMAGLGKDINVAGYQHFLFVSGGIGITPMQSICNDILHQHEAGRKIKHARFIWAVRDRYMVDCMLPHDISITERPGSVSPDGSPRLPLSFSPDGLLRHNNKTVRGAKANGAENKSEGPVDESDPLMTEFYLTRVRDEAEFKKANINPVAQKMLSMGRPKLAEITADVHARAKADLAKSGRASVRVAVLTCGPTSMTTDMRKLCAKLSGGGVFFDYHTEAFML